MSRYETIEQIIRAARSFIGSPFRHAGRSRETGVDCVGLLLCALHESGVTTWDDSEYSRVVNPDRLRAEIELFCDPVLSGYAGTRDSRDFDERIHDLQPGDVLLFNIQGTPQHVGIYTGEDPLTGLPSLLHAYEGVGKVVEHPLDAKWTARIATVYRWRGTWQL